MARKDGPWYWRHVAHDGVVHFIERSVWRGVVTTRCDTADIGKPNHRGEETPVTCIRCLGIWQNDSAHLAALQASEDEHA